MNSINQKQKYIYFVFLFLVLVWNSLIVLAPYLADRGHSFASGIIYFSFSKVCHQMASRSFFVLGHQFAACSRCSGIYFGFLLSTITFFLFLKANKIELISPKIFWIALVLLIADFALGYTSIGNGMWSRFFTGFFTGAIALFFVLPPLLQLGKIHSKSNSK